MSSSNELLLLQAERDIRQRVGPTSFGIAPGACKIPNKVHLLRYLSIIDDNTADTPCPSCNELSNSVAGGIDIRSWSRRLLSHKLQHDVLFLEGGAVLHAQSHVTTVKTQKPVASLLHFVLCPGYIVNIPSSPAAANWAHQGGPSARHQHHRGQGVRGREGQARRHSVSPVHHIT